MANDSIAGEWRGHYQYSDVVRRDQGSGFSAFIKENSGHIEGTIVDDFKPTNSTFSGSFSYPSVHFTKVYTNPCQTIHTEKQGDKMMYWVSNYSDPVDYQGSMSEDGKTISGTWTLTTKKGTVSNGTWIAYRVEEAEEARAAETETHLKIPLFDENLV